MCSGDGVCGVDMCLWIIMSRFFLSLLSISPLLPHVTTDYNILEAAFRTQEDYVSLDPPVLHTCFHFVTFPPILSFSSCMISSDHHPRLDLPYH